MAELPYKRICKQCNTNFRSKGGNKQFCTQECKLKFNLKSYIYRLCENCKTNVRVYPNGYNKDCKTIFCSNKCQGKWMSQNSEQLGLAKRAKKMRENWNENAWKKSVETRKENGNIIIEHNWKQYWKRCNYLTQKIRKQMLQNWDGYDYIDGEYIKENLNLSYTHKNYPTLDHIIPRSECFKQGLTPDEATQSSNLKFTKRYNNSKKSNKV